MALLSQCYLFIKEEHKDAGTDCSKLFMLEILNKNASKIISYKT